MSDPYGAGQRRPRQQRDTAKRVAPSSPHGIAAPALQTFEATAAPPAPHSIEGLIEAAVGRAIRHSLGPYLHRLSACEPAVYTVAQSAEVLQVSEDTIGRMVRRGVLPRVPHVGGKVLIPKRALHRLIEGSEPAHTAPVAEDAKGAEDGDPRSSRSIRSAAS
jgi:excisionase family DNA binding protein